MLSIVYIYIANCVFPMNHEFEESELHPPIASYNHQKTKSETYWKYGVLFFAVWITIPAFYCFDQPVALFPVLQQYFSADAHSLDFEIFFALLYFLYAFGSAILPLFTGGMRDCNGDKVIMCLVALNMVVGQLLFIVGILWKSVILMIFGRIVLGWGVESLLPLLASYLAPFFRSNIVTILFNQSIVLAILQFGSQIGLVSSIYITPILQERYGLVWCLLSGVILLLIGFVLLATSFYIDSLLEQLNYISSYRLANTSEIIFQEDVQHSRFYWFKFNDFKIYPYMFWLLLAFNSLLYCSIVTLVNVSMYVMASILFKIDNQFQLLDIALFWMLGCCSLIVIGPLVNYVGNRKYMILCSVLIIMSGHIQYVTTPHFGLVLLAVGYCLAFVSTWSSIIYIIRLSAFGKAFGITVCFQNLIYVFMPFILEAVNQRILGTFKVLLLMCVLALIAAIQIIVEDTRQCNILDNQNAIRVQYKKRRVDSETDSQIINENDHFANQLDKNK